MKYFNLLLVAALVLSGCANHYPTNAIPEKQTFVEEERFYAPPEDLRSVVGHDGWYHHGGYYYPSRSYYNRYNGYYDRRARRGRR